MTATADTTFVAMLYRCVVGVDPDEAALADLVAYHAAHGDMGTFEHLTAMMPPAPEPDFEPELTLADVLRPLCPPPRPARRWYVDDPLVIALYLLVLVSLACAIAASIHLGWLPSR